MTTPLSDLLTSHPSAALTRATPQPNDPRWVALMMETAVTDRDPRTRTALPKAYCSSVPHVDPTLVGRWMNLPGHEEHDLASILTLPGWAPENLAVVLTALADSHPALVVPALAWDQLPETSRRGLLAALRDRHRGTLRDRLPHLRPVPAWLANDTIDLAPAEALARYIRAATDPDPVARRLLSIHGIDERVWLEAATWHRFATRHQRRLLARIRQEPPRRAVNRIIALLEDPAGTARDRVEARIAETGRCEELHAADYRDVVAEVTAGQALSTTAGTLQLLIDAASYVEAATVRAAVRAWLPSLPSARLANLASGTPVVRTPGLRDDMVAELAGRARHEDADALSALVAGNYQVLTDDPRLLELARTSIPLSTLRTAPVAGRLLTGELTRLYGDGGLHAAATFAELYPSCDGTLADLADLCDAALYQPATATEPVAELVG